MVKLVVVRERIEPPRDYIPSRDVVELFRAAAPILAASVNTGRPYGEVNSRIGRKVYRALYVIEELLRGDGEAESVEVDIEIVSLVKGVLNHVGIHAFVVES